MDLNLLWVIQLAPLVAFLLIQLLPQGLKKIAPAVGMAFAATAALAALRLFCLHSQGHDFPIEYSSHWLEVGERFSLSVGFLLDQVNLLMITIVTVIAFFVQIFSFYYMAEDPSRSRYFGFLSFFTFAMTGLVLSTNLLQTFMFWELVGLASYLLIGFWYQKPSAATAARKAFVINRLADLGFYLGIVILFLIMGTLDFSQLTAGRLNSVTWFNHGLTITALLIFAGVMGKSAQFPFHVWLPDAMEGPTPVSALIHSATMVAAGVFLLVRAYGLFASSETALFVILVIGTLTSLISAATATVQRDIKKILAYSTVSQLGLMVMAVGAGEPVAGFFHLSTHAFFKSLLFLTAGAFIHHFHTNDIFEIAKKGGKTQKLSMAALFLGLASLCGIAPFSGFFSKDMILEALKHHSPFFYSAGLFVSFLTAFYSFRLVFVLLFSKTEPSHGHAHGEDAHHESGILSLCRALPLVSLALISLVVGFAGTPVLDNRILHWLGAEHGFHFDPEVAGLSTGLIVLAALIAFFLFRNPAKAEKPTSGALTRVLENKFYIDEVYVFLVKTVGLGIAAVMNAFDRYVINGLMVNQTSYGILRIGRLASKIQNGFLQDYLSVALGAAILMIFAVILK